MVSVRGICTVMPMIVPALTRRGAVVSAVAAVLICTACSSTPAINRTPVSGATTAAVVDGIQEVTITTGDDYRFHPAHITVHPGRVRITLVNKGNGAPHDLQVLGIPGDYVPLAQGSSSTVATFTAPAPGTYTFVCTIHQKQGQTGTLTVLAK